MTSVLHTLRAGGWREALIGGVVAAAGVALGVAATTYPLEHGGQPGPGWWPGLLALVMIVLGAGIAASVVRGVPPPPSADAAVPGRWRHVAVSGALLVGFVLLWPVVGWVPAGVVAFGLMSRLAGASWVVAAAWAAAVSALLFVVFSVLLDIPL